jgi:hypothetical protein
MQARSGTLALARIAVHIAKSTSILVPATQRYRSFERKEGQ